MNKQKMLKWVNAAMAITFLMTASGGVVRYFFPDVIPYENFRLLHPNAGILLVALILCHIWLNFGWIRANFLKK